MNIDDMLLSKLERLTMLSLSANERATLMSDLNKMLAMVDALKDVDTTGVTPLTQVNETVNQWRTDQVSGMVDRTAALKNAPKTDGEFFLVPKVIK